MKAPKVYLKDSGLLHAFLGLERMEDIESHPKLGASWEGFALERCPSGIGKLSFDGAHNSRWLG
jgi:hypothetical protein